VGVGCARQVARCGGQKGKRRWGALQTSTPGSVTTHRSESQRTKRFPLRQRRYGRRFGNHARRVPQPRRSGRNANRHAGMWWKHSHKPATPARVGKQASQAGSEQARVVTEGRLPSVDQVGRRGEARWWPTAGEWRGAVYSTFTRSMFCSVATNILRGLYAS